MRPLQDDGYDVDIFNGQGQLSRSSWPWKLLALAGSAEEIENVLRIQLQELAAGEPWYDDFRTHPHHQFIHVLRVLNCSTSQNQRCSYGLCH